MNQPTKDQLKDQLALAAEEIIRLREGLDLRERMASADREAGKQFAEVAFPIIPIVWWRRWFR